MKSFAQLKKDLKVGTTIKTIANNIKPEKTGEIRKIVKVQTNAIAFDTGNPERPSYLWWDKASCYDYDNDIIKVYHERDGQRILDFVYQIIA